MRTSNDLHKFAGTYQGKRPTMYRWEMDDCSVQAIRHAYDLPYDTAWRLCASHGRTARKGFDIVRRLFPALKLTFWDWTRGLTLEFLLKHGMLKHGTFFVISPKHIFVVKGGKVLDHIIANRKIMGVWKIEESEN